MLMNRDVFATDPTMRSIPNEGVTKVMDPRTEQEWEVLRYELSSFVCDGEYRAGLERVLSSYLAHLNQPSQPAVWVSGFYGSGKSHFVRVLEYLWRDVVLPDQASARSVARLPQEIQDALRELTTAGKRAGGLWSAAGTLGAGAGNSVRLALLSILFRSADLPEQYAPAHLAIWLKQNGYYKPVREAIESGGKDFHRELNNMYVSPILTQALLGAYPDFAPSPGEARSLLKAQYPIVTDISDDEMLMAIGDVLALQSSTPGKLPCTLLIFDELQQYIGEDAGRTLQVQNVVEACSSRFGSQLLFVATGQAALQATTQLSKLQGRFSVRVTLGDTDVERVVREVVLRKRQDQVPALQAVLEKARGEIDRELAGTKIGPTLADVPDLVPDYPLLPARRRFWESVLRAVDSAGTAGQLRTQLRIVHEAARDVANAPLGTVVPGDVIYGQLKLDMLQSGVLLREVNETVERLDDGTPDGKLKARLCAAIFLIGKLPIEGISVTGLRSTAATLADLLVEDISAGSDALRQRIPRLLQQLVDAGTLMLVADEYRLQTRESTEWEQDYRRRLAQIKNDETRIASERTTELRNAITAALKGVTIVQGKSKTPRKYELHFGLDAPSMDSTAVQVWIRDGWGVSEKTVRDDAQAAGTESPIVYAFVPRTSSDELTNALASYAAADATLKERPSQTTAEGIEARNAMLSRRDIERGRVTHLIEEAIGQMQVFLGGGHQLPGRDLPGLINEAVNGALSRLFPQFGKADDPRWGTVVRRAAQGAADALSALDYNGDVDKHPVCREVRDFIGGAGKRGSEIQKHFTGTGYGWTRDAVDGALLGLVMGGFVRAVKNGQPIGAKQIEQGQIGVTEFFSEGITITMSQRIGVRGLIQNLVPQIKSGEELEAVPMVLSRLAAMADGAGGDPPLPLRPSTATLDRLKALSGNEQFVAVYNERDQLQADAKAWGAAQQKIAERQPRWRLWQEFLSLAQGLPAAEAIATQAEAIQANRALLDDPDPVAPLLASLTAALRQALQTARQRYDEAYKRSLDGLKASDDWKRLSEPEAQRILRENSVDYVAMPGVGTDEALLEALRKTPLSTIEAQTIALTTRMEQARAAAAKQLEPLAVTVTVSHATLRTPEEVDRYLAALREEILGHIKAGKPVML